MPASLLGVPVPSNLHPGFVWLEKQGVARAFCGVRVCLGVRWRVGLPVASGGELVGAVAGNGGIRAGRLQAAGGGPGTGSAPGA